MDKTHSESLCESNLIVCARIRPSSVSDEIMNKICFKLDEKLISVLDPPTSHAQGFHTRRRNTRTYKFDRVFDETCSQEDVYNCTASGIINHVANGYNATVFASGATGTGKTYTMVGTDSNPGIMVRTLEELYSRIASTSPEKCDYKFTMAYMELYNEILRDLLRPNSDYLELREDSHGVRIVGLHQVEPKDKFETFQLLHQANSNRTTEPTAANKTSSRSHAILQITIKRTSSATKDNRVGKLFLIDLAGSERASKTKNRGRRMMEGAHINRSLLALGNCINALSDPANGKRYVNYRDSKLTRLLKDALAGNCRTIMIAHLSPSSEHFEETCNTLVYAARAKHIKTKIRENVTKVNRELLDSVQVINDSIDEIKRLNHDSNAMAVENQAETFDKLKKQLTAAQKHQLNLRQKLIEVKTNLLQLDSTECEQLPLDKISFVTSASSGNIMRLSSEEMLSTQRLGPYLSQQDISTRKHERVKLEKSLERIEQEHDAAKDQVQILTEAIHQNATSPENREILELLCRLHAMELEYIDMQFQTSGEGFTLSHLQHSGECLNSDRALCEEIIRFQANLLSINQVETPEELQRLMELYSRMPNVRKSNDASCRSSEEDASAPLESTGSTSCIPNHRNVSSTTAIPYTKKRSGRFEKLFSIHTSSSTPNISMCEFRTPVKHDVQSSGFDGINRKNSQSQSSLNSSPGSTIYGMSQCHRHFTEVNKTELIIQTSSKSSTLDLKPVDRAGLHHHITPNESNIYANFNHHGVQELRKNSLIRLNTHLRESKCAFSQPTPTRQRSKEDLNRGPLIRPIKIIPIDPKNRGSTNTKEKSHASKIPRFNKSSIRMAASRQHAPENRNQATPPNGVKLRKAPPATPLQQQRFPQNRINTNTYLIVEKTKII